MSSQPISTTAPTVRPAQFIDALAHSTFPTQPPLSFKYYGLLALATLLGLGYGLIFSDVFFPNDKPAPVYLVMTLLKLAWLVPLPYALVNFYGYFRCPVFRQPPPTPTYPPLPIRLYFRYVTRGNNPNLIQENVSAAYAILSQTLANGEWMIEVVTDIWFPLDEAVDPRVRVIVVPPAYRPPQGAKYKARALQYALEASTAHPDDWIIHLDEETRFDAQTVRAIHAFVAEQRFQLAQGEQPYPAIGQGAIMYGRGRVVNWVTTLADSIRVADDLGRFRLQFEHGKALFGLHGSFIVINHAVERLIGFDHGAAGSITEDSYFALVAQQLGIRFKFLPAFMYERSPFTIRDFIQQRRRWFGGLWLCVRAGAMSFKVRAVLGLFMLMWSLSWLCPLVTVVNLLYPTGTPLPLSLLAGLTFIYNVSMYVLGFLVTYHPQDGRRRFVQLLILQVLLIPFFSLMEGAAVIYGLIKPPAGFFIVQKEDDTLRSRAAA